MDDENTYIDFMDYLDDESVAWMDENYDATPQTILNQSSTIRGRTNIAHFEDIFINFFVCKFSFLLLIIHALKPPRFLVCDNLRKIFCKINPIKAKKEIETMYYVPDGTDSFITGAIHPVLQQVQMAGHIGIMMTALI